ncbi:MAG: hypothetical protein PVH61_11655 [Candidatus Aminicenantes bacterium]|jgi:hypothetical protein
MKKIIILILMLLFVISGFGFADSKKEEESKKPPSIYHAVTKTYVLKHVSPRLVHQTLHQYFWQSSYDNNGNMFTVKIAKENIPKFEELLEKLDVEKKKILIRIFTVIASQEGKTSAVQNKDLRQVLSELQKILSFKSFRLDGVSAITVKDGQHRSRLLLSSHSPLLLILEDVSIKGEKQGQRTINFEFALRQKTEPFVMKDGNLVYETLIESETSVKEKGYLVAGVSKIDNGDSLVLVINAEIR